MAADFFDMCDISKRQANLELNADPEVREAKIKVANEAADYWKSIAPVGDPAKDKHSGQYRDSIHVHEGKGIAVIADAPNAWFVEYGTNNIGEHACRARTEAVFNKRYKQAEGGE
jgi:hypothetical protein